MNQSATSPTKRIAPPGVIVADAVYTLDEFKACMRIGKHAMRTARNQGLKVRRHGQRAYILGRDAIAWLESTAV